MHLTGGFERTMTWRISKNLIGNAFDVGLVVCFFILVLDSKTGCVGKNLKSVLELNVTKFGWFFFLVVCLTLCIYFRKEIK